MADSDGLRLELYSGKPQHEVFARMVDLFPCRRMEPGAPRPLLVGGALDLPDEFHFEGARRDVRDFLSSTDTSALLVLKAGQLRFEEYFLSGGRAVNWISWSVAKSFVSALVGIAVEEGHIASISDAMDRYVPALKASAYEGVAIRDVLHMSSGSL